ncbi:MAG: hypothetical protein ACREBG_01820 [Pyrinomonadaceae bacterium]
MTLTELQGTLEERGASVVIIVKGKQITVAVHELIEHADSRDARPSQRYCGECAFENHLETAVSQALSFYDKSTLSLGLP